MDTKEIIRIDDYEKLRRKLDLFPIGLPRSGATMRILQLLFSEQDARVACHVPNPPVMHSAARIAARAGAGEKETAARLADMAKRGLIVEMKLLIEKRYTLLPAVPGFIEMQFTPGRELTDNIREAGRLWHEALDGNFGEENYGHPTSGVRVLPIRKTVDTKQNVFSFEEAEKLIRKSGSMAITDCACRKAAGKCDAPLDVCLFLNASADYLVSRGIVRRATMREMTRALERSADAGLVPTVSNTMPPVQIICNCCKCCCASLYGVTALGKPADNIRSNFQAARLKTGKCKFCGACAKACPVQAISVSKEIEELTIDPERCLGCGVCAHKCPTDSITLKRRSARKPMPTSLHLAAQMLGERGKTARLLDNAIREIF